MYILSHSFTMPSDDSTPPFKSSIADIILPPEGFQSKIPPHLLENCDEATKWIMQEMSKSTQVSEFVLHATLEHNRHLRALNGKTFKNERGLSEIQDTVITLNEKVTLLDPLFKPTSLFLRMWDYRLFRYGVYIILFFLITYALPYYLSHPLSLSGLWTLLTGT